jgi:hypothetical protein
MNKGLLIILIGIYAIVLWFLTKAALTIYHTTWDLWREVIFLEKLSFFATVILFLFFRFTGLRSYIMLFLIPLLICFSSLAIYYILVFTVNVTSGGFLHLISISLVNFTGTLIAIAVYWNTPKSAG